MFTNKKRAGRNVFVCAVSLYVAKTLKTSIKDHEPAFPIYLLALSRTVLLDNLSQKSCTSTDTRSKVNQVSIEILFKCQPSVNQVKGRLRVLLINTWLRMSLVEIITSFLYLVFFFFQYRSKILKIEPIFSQGLHSGGLIGENFININTCNCVKWRSS